MVSDALALRRVSKAFGDRRVLRNVTLALPSGTTTALIGPSASGKTVLLKIAAGLIAADGGNIDMFGQRNISDWRSLRQRIGVLFQRNALFDSMSIWENVAFPLERRKVSRAEAKEAAFALLRQVGLEERAGRGMPIALSGGMQKRAALARAVAGSPDLLLLDDPTAGLDPVLAASMEQLIRRMTRHYGATALVVTSEVSQLAERFDRIAILDEGRIIWSGPGAEMAPDVHPLLAAA